ncbi:organic solute transporter Ostalpha-domain-containing protein [Irpex rosettiformis]|uniref:Organic solute transporter Ostalpha-domain-containing protein n=1 Tax=Irpex rosettiformis TaxID=378272 RepID=A0ACB8TPI9_9APHY|nr:organic solute transporter Ostalpha-domain-containing protein [Irpex rosettiformis]
MVIRIMVMVPLYAIASLISLFSLEAAFFIDAVRDIYEAFVIYCFFDLLIAYLGGERSLIMAMHGRPPKYPIFPGNFFWPEVDVSDPYTFLFLKRGIIQYVQIKPILAVVTIILKAVGKYNEGDLRANSGYLYVSIVYNLSICMALYCLAIFWMCVNDDLKPFRPMPKFLCVKGILFFSFWQGIFISILVATRVIVKLGPYTDSEHISLALTDALVCIEMPFFAIAHQYAFSTVDYVDKHLKSAARMPMAYAFRDAFGLKDVVEDTKATLRGEGMDYREFEPSEGFIHQGAGRDRRIRAGLRYSQGGKHKYWLPQSTTSTQTPGKAENRINKAIGRVTGRPEQGEEVYAPLLSSQEEDVVHLAPDLQSSGVGEDNIFSLRDSADTGFDLPFGDPDPADDELFAQSKKYLFGDYNYPVVDVSSDDARMRIWVEEERILRDERGVYFSPILGPNRSANNSKQGYGAVETSHRPNVRTRHDSDTSNSSKSKGKIREVVVDKEQDRLTDKTNGDVRLGWTKLGGDRSVSAQPPRIRTLSSQGLKRSSSNSLAGSSSSRDPPPSTPRKDGERPALPPDAVDLVVEDTEAGHDDTAHDRRKGEPAGLRKVYRRGYVVDDNEGRKEGEVEIANGDGMSGTPFAIGDDVDEATRLEATAVEDMTATVATTPPAYARVTVDHFPPHEDENPWA